MGDSYMSDVQTNYLKAFWTNHSSCAYVVSEKRAGMEGEVYFFDIKGKKADRAR